MKKVQQEAFCLPDIGFRFVILSLGVFMVLVWTTVVQADTAVNLEGDLYTPGSGSVSLSYQYIEVNKFQNGKEKIDIGKVETNTIYLELEYILAQRWRLQLGIPYIWKSFNGIGRHDPLALVPPRPDVPYIDDGSYNRDFQDVYTTVHYLWKSNPVQLEPFVAVIYPTHNYPHFGNAAVGQNLWKVEVGLELTKFMPFSDWYYRLAGSYTFVEKTLGVNVNKIGLAGQVGYFFTPRFGMNLFFLGKKGKGNSAQMFPPGPARTTEAWYQHDRTLQHSYLDAGIGAEYYIGDKWEVNGALLATVWGESVHWVDHSGTIELTRYFEPRGASSKP